MPAPLAERLAATGVPFHVWGCERGRDILRHPREYATALEAVGPDGVLLPERNFIGTALRLGGYRGPMVAVEHGTLLLTEASTLQAVAQRLSTLTAARAHDVEVGVSDFMVERMRRGAHAPRLCRIYNGLDPLEFAPAAEEPQDRDNRSDILVGFAARLIPGKGADDAIAALAQARAQRPMRLVIAGKGPEQQRLMSLARALDVSERVEFLGLVRDMRAFWQRCDVALFPSHQFIESFGMAALEAMACGKPVIATRNGAVPEVVIDELTGTIVEAGRRRRARASARQVRRRS